ncbi:Gfo/Idh/MocA family protein [Streptomyces flavofungini]|uniref:Gfo/Idh/MocA family oxidoreductase n=1 Tax=Streptomyces flavofungini TaxID=68200 RepID=A0ABS0X2B7_9ACTN|nr:Gfo/Idh/MocA family oxidoreductase [Streptomyces flavofungini]MBJ3807326.1 Gfo/Idh/MocA family oxidoreductase [Streptomyces flavofungini]GHC58385.1 NADH-dependent dehydrogenase [Streptomyces flavofungini]
MRWGIAGYGDVVERRVLPALRALGEEPVRLWGRDGQRAARVAARHGVPFGGADVEMLIRGIDAVYVATPVVHHVPLAGRVLRAGLPVLVEKPLAGGLWAGAGVGGGARSGAGVEGGRHPEFGVGGGSYASFVADDGPCAGVAYYRRLAPAVLRLREELRGWTPERAEVRFRCAFDPGPGHPMRWRTDPALSGGGVLADAGSHRLDLLHLLFGRPEEVRARLDRRFPEGAERLAEVELRWASGTRARVCAEWSGEPPVDRFEVSGGGRTLTLDPLDSGRLRHHGTARERQLTLPPAANPHQPLIADFVAAVAAGRPPVCPLAQAHLVDEVLVAAARSDATGGGPVRLSLPADAVLAGRAGAQAPSSADQARSHRGSGVSD